MFQIFSDWYKEYFSNREAVVLILLLAVGLTIVVTMGSILAPVLTAIVLAYLLQGMISFLVSKKVPWFASLLFTYVLFLAAQVSLLFVLVPLAWGQLVRLFNDQVPRMLYEANLFLNMLPQRYPELVSEQWVKEISTLTSTTLKSLGESVLTFSVSSIPNLMGILIFLVLVPMLVFFFLKDKDRMINWVDSYLPQDRPFISRVIKEMDVQISNYVRGKALEILIVGSVTYVTFVLLGVNYAALLGMLVGLSVVVPYIGATVVTIPVAVVAYFQFGWGPEFMWVLVSYGIIQGLDGNLLVPILFSEAVNLHPVAIITAVLVFGGFWGLWGVFFAIPLATLVKAVFSSWPREPIPVLVKSGSVPSPGQDGGLL
ncbi:AI-2E family transporter [Ketobacter sp. MCCC 1A13808]|uniref:AI-2E family transporter n=1 Tax=Ketobacter sp. MCCC 1A13808 TaxID=2602738 RepID=UPI000F1EEDDC|nr:AI-2E family transporter [Ketobacter sp. MCCC 1A13808]MVF10738.1 AI-2E family transporter [Ketobacter sp. MCCC 1A13808]RLP56154.1 MAG: AI-2E family transporter [Ketobacter sp.]